MVCFDGLPQICIHWSGCRGQAPEGHPAGCLYVYELMAIIRATQAVLKQSPEILDLIRDRLGELHEIRHMRKPFDDSEGDMLTYFVDSPEYKHTQELYVTFGNERGKTEILSID